MAIRRPHVLVLGGSFAGLAAARHIRKYCGELAEVTLIDKKPYLIFIPNILPDILAGHDPAETLHMNTHRIIEGDGTRFIQAEVQDIDLDTSSVRYTPSERPGSAPEHIGYDYLVIALGARLAYEKLRGFSEYGHTFSDTYHAAKLMDHFSSNGYKGRGIAIGSDAFSGSRTAYGGAMPEMMSSCEYPLVEAMFALGTWLGDLNIARMNEITFFTPGEGMLCEAGKGVSAAITNMAKKAGCRIITGTGGISHIAQWGVAFESGGDVEAELKIVLPEWAAHDILRRLPVADGTGFLMTDRSMRCSGYPNVFAVGDCASLTVPKLGELGYRQAAVAAASIAGDMGITVEKGEGGAFVPEIIFIGDLGHNKAFYIHSDLCYGGTTSVFKTGYSYYSMKLGFKEVFFRTGGRPPSWGVPLAELVAERLT